MNRNVIVTGATGFIGSYLVKELLENDYQVYVPVRNKEKLKSVLKEFCQHPQLHVIKADLDEEWASKLPFVEYDTFFHLGWSGVNRKDINDEAIHTKSLHNSIKCLEIAQKKGCRSFVSAGSKAEYGSQEVVQDEKTLCKPVSAYGKAKLKFYNEAYSYCRNCGMNFYHARLFSVIGVGDHPWSLVSAACDNFLVGEAMEFGPCTQMWNFTAVEDVVKGLRSLAECKRMPEPEDNRIYNIAGRDTRVLRDFVEEISKICNSSSKKYFAEAQATEDFMNPSTEKIRALTGWCEKITFEESIRRILKNNGK